MYGQTNFVNYLCMYHFLRYTTLLGRHCINICSYIAFIHLSKSMANRWMVHSSFSSRLASPLIFATSARDGNDILGRKVTLTRQIIVPISALASVKHFCRSFIVAVDVDVYKGECVKGSLHSWQQKHTELAYAVILMRYNEKIFFHVIYWISWCINTIFFKYILIIITN